MSALITTESTTRDMMSGLCQHAAPIEMDSDDDRPDDEILISDEAVYQLRIEGAIRDMDSFTNWLMTECADERPFEHQFHGEARYQIGKDYAHARSLKTGDLLFLLLIDPNANVMRACRDEIIERFTEKKL